MEFNAIDVFCGIGGLSYGLRNAGIKISAGIDLDKTCTYAFTSNVKSDFIAKDVKDVHGSELKEKYWDTKEDIKILVGCAPCQPYFLHLCSLE